MINPALQHLNDYTKQFKASDEKKHEVQSRLILDATIGTILEEAQECINALDFIATEKKLRHLQESLHLLVDQLVELRDKECHEANKGTSDVITSIEHDFNALGENISFDVLMQFIRQRFTVEALLTPLYKELGIEVTIH